MHGDVVGEFIVAADHVNHSGDLGTTVHVRVETALGFHADKAAEGHVLTDLADEARADLFEGLAINRQGGEGSDVSRVLFRDEAGTSFSHGDEVRVLRNEVSFRVDFEESAELAVVRHVNTDNTFSGDASGSLVGLVAQLHAEDFLSLGEIAFSSHEGLLALHHRSVGLLAKVFHHCGGNSGHLILQILINLIRLKIERGRTQD